MDSTNPTLTLKHAPIQSGEAIDWLNAKWRRHGEPEDKYSAELIALLTSKLRSCESERDEALRRLDRCEQLLKHCFQRLPSRDSLNHQVSDYFRENRAVDSLGRMVPTEECEFDPPPTIFDRATDRRGEHEAPRQPESTDSGVVPDRNCPPDCEHRDTYHVHAPLDQTLTAPDKHAQKENQNGKSTTD